MQRKMEALWLKSQGIAHYEICRLTRISATTLMSYLRAYRDGGIEAMKHLEASPFANMGPDNALEDNNRKYLEYPRLRTGLPPKVNLSDPLEWMADGSGFSPAAVARWLEGWGINNIGCSIRD